MITGLIAFAVAAALCGTAFLSCFLADNPHLVPALPQISWGVSEPAAVAPAPAAPGLYRDASGRWRDATTRRFAKAPV